jgi:hypothetical protein
MNIMDGQGGSLPFKLRCFGIHPHLASPIEGEEHDLSPPP